MDNIVSDHDLLLQICGKYGIGPRLLAHAVYLAAIATDASTIFDEDASRVWLRRFSTYDDTTQQTYVLQAGEYMEALAHVGR